MWPLKLLQLSGKYAGPARVLACGVVWWGCIYRKQLGGKTPSDWQSLSQARQPIPMPGNPIGTNSRYASPLGRQARGGNSGTHADPRYRQCSARDFSVLACFTRIDRIAARLRVRPVYAVQ